MTHEQQTELPLPQSENLEPQENVQPAGDTAVSGSEQPVEEAPATGNQAESPEPQTDAAELEKEDAVQQRTGQKVFSRYMEALPEIQKARAMQAKAQDMQIQLEMDREMQEIQRLNPGIKKQKDLEEMPTYRELLRFLSRGNSLVDAYKLANFQDITEAAAAAQKQQLLNRLGETAHLTQTAPSQAAPMAAVPAEVMRQYHMFNPLATDAEIQRHYNREAGKGN